MQFNDLLRSENIDPKRSENIDPKEVIVFRHRPKERKLREVLPWLVEENPAVFNAYQQTQNPRVEKAMMRAKYVASFIGHEAGKAVFVGLYKNKNEGSKILSYRQLLKIPAHKELVTKYGLRSENRPKIKWFNLVLLRSFCSGWKGKLIVRWPGKEVSWWRWADRNEFLIHAITEDSIFVPKISDWKQLTLSWNKLHVLPKRWREELSRWRGIYFILDETDGKGYVGSAYGKENLYGRWCSYAKSGHGGNKKLKGRNPEKFRFSILQIVPHDMEKKEVIAIEETWKDRLHTCEFGLNDRHLGGKKEKFNNLK